MLDPTYRAEWQQLAKVTERLHAVHSEYEALTSGRLGADHRDAANVTLTQRAVELCFAATDDFHFGRPVAGAVMGRCLLETAVTLRWCLMSPEYAQRWWDEGDASIQKTLRTLAVSDDPDVVRLRDAPAIGIGLPSMQKRAQVGNLLVPYKRWYHTLSAYSHPHRMSTGHAYGRPDEPLMPLIVPCTYFASDVGLVFSTWVNERRVADPAPHP